MNQALTVHYDPRLVEEAVFHAQRDSEIAREVEQARNRLYEIADWDEREARFNALNSSWFARLGLGDTVEQVLQEQAIVISQIKDCFVVRATQAKEEGAELFVAQGGDRDNPAIRTLRVLLRPESLLDAKSLVTFLRHEFFHIADMLDPAYGYEPTLPKAEGGPTYDTLITNRYRVLWDVTIAGRMARRGWCDEAVRTQQLGDFFQAFPMLAESSENLFAKFFAAEQPKHADLAAFAFDPRAATDSLSNPAVAATHCSLCRFPTHTFQSAPAQLGAEVLAAIKADFPDWTPIKGLCIQCADLYRGRQMSLDALRRLPGYISSSV